MKLGAGGPMRARFWRRAPVPSRSKIRECLGGAGHQLGLDPAGEEGPRQASRAILRDGAGALCRHAADDHGARQQRARDRQSRLFDARHRHRECRLGRPAHRRRRVPGRRRRLLFAGIHGAQGRPDPEGRGPQGQGGRHQRRRQRRRRRHEERCCTSTAWSTTATTRWSRRRSPPCRRCWRSKKVDLISGGAAVLATIRSCATSRAICSCRRTPSASPT